jgi:protein dithiol:quinone oxidoreductase
VTTLDSQAVIFRAELMPSQGPFLQNCGKTGMLFLYRLSRQSVSWLILFRGALAPFLVALIFQHWLGMPPCVLCICQRLALLGIVLSSLLVLPAPQCRYLRALGVSLWGYSAFRGLLAAWEQIQRYLHPSQFIPCAFRVHFPE